MSSPRIAPIDPPYEAPTEQMLGKWMGPDSDLEPLKLFRTLAVHETLFSRMRPFGAGILVHGLLEPRVRELMILRTCARCGAEYEWGVHVELFAASVGLTPAEIEATAHADAEDSVWSARDRGVIGLADELHEAAAVSDATFAELECHFSAAQILELAIAGGWYRTISYVIDAARVELEPWAARFPPPRFTVSRGTARVVARDEARPSGY